MNNAFHQARHDTELKLMLIHTLENFDESLADVLNQTIKLCNDREILEFIVTSKIKKYNGRNLVKEFYIFLSQKNANLDKEVAKVLGEEYLRELLKK